MGVYDELRYPWLTVEKDVIERTIRSGKLVLGICLGAQLIADVLGARVYAAPHKEIGWFPVERTEAASTTKIGDALPQTIEAFHWHGDTFDLPFGAVHLASSLACENQAFVYQNRVLALQYHLETTRTSAEALIENCAHELVDGPYVQPAKAILSNEERFQRINDAMRTLVVRFASRTNKS